MLLPKIALGLLMVCCTGCSPFSDSKPANDQTKADKPDPTQRTKTDKTSLANICKGIQAEKAPGPLTSMTELSDRFLKSHNDIRSRYGLPALKWEAQIAQYAQAWANYLRDSHQCEMRHRSALKRTDGKRYGENLAWNWTSQVVASGSFKSSPEFGNLAWSKECEDYDYDTNTCVTGKMCGHLTQVIWKDTKWVGCGMAVCNQGEGSYIGKGRAEVWVCNYDPPGNITMIDSDKTETKLRPF